MRNEILSIPYVDRLVVDVIPNDPGEAVRIFLSGSKAVKASYMDDIAPICAASPQADAHREQIEENTRERHNKQRHMFMDRFKGNPHVHFEAAEWMVAPESKRYEINLSLNHGDIADRFWESRSQMIANRYFRADDEELSSRMASDVIRYYKKSIDDILSTPRANGIIRLWHGINADCLCAFYYFVWLLKGIDCTVIDVSLPETVRKSNGRRVRVRSWAELRPEEMCIPVSAAKVMSSENRRLAAEQWEKMVNENALLRVSENGVIKGAEVSYYDGLILESLSPVRSIPALRLIPKLWNRAHKLGTDDLADWFWMWRIEELMDDGRIRYMRPSRYTEDPSNFWIKKCCEDQPEGSQKAQFV